MTDIINHEQLKKRLLLDVLRALDERGQTTVAVYLGGMYRDTVQRFLDRLDQTPSTNEQLFFLLATSGGQADGAYILARALRARFKKVTFGIFGYCKSAGTLATLGAHELVMGPEGELGPIDVQLIKDDELLRRNSGLDVLWSLQVLSREQYRVFEETFLSIVRQSGGAITTTRAMDIATELARGLIAPIAQQLEPVRLGEIQRQLEVATEYGRRLGAKEDVLDRLLNTYPCHSFVIDYDEAADLHLPVRKPNEDEQALYDCLTAKSREAFRNPPSSNDNAIILVGPELLARSAQKDEQPDERQPEPTDTASVPADGDATPSDGAVAKSQHPAEPPIGTSASPE